MDPHFVFKFASPVGNQFKFRKCYAMRATLTCDVPLAVFVWWGYIEISSNNTSTGTVKNLWQPWTSLYINSDEFISSLSLAPMLTTRTSAHNTPKPCGCSRATNIRRTVFFTKNCPLGKNLDWSDLAGTRARRQPFLPLIMLVPHKHVPRALWMCRYVRCLKMVSILNDCWLLHVINEYILYYWLITPFLTHALVYLLAEATINLLEKRKRKLESNLCGGIAWLR